MRLGTKYACLIDRIGLPCNSSNTSTGFFKTLEIRLNTKPTLGTLERTFAAVSSLLTRFKKSSTRGLKVSHGPATNIST